MEIIVTIKGTQYRAELPDSDSIRQLSEQFPLEETFQKSGEHEFFCRLGCGINVRGMDGTLNYYSEQTDSLNIDIKDDTALMTGHSKVAAAVFGGGRHTWRLALKFDVKKTDEGWKLTKAQASTW